MLGCSCWDSSAGRTQREAWPVRSQYRANQDILDSAAGEEHNTSLEVLGRLYFS